MALVCSDPLVHEIEHDVARRVAGILVVNTGDVPRSETVHGDHTRQPSVACSDVVEGTLGVAEALTDCIDIFGVCHLCRGNRFASVLRLHREHCYHL